MTPIQFTADDEFEWDGHRLRYFDHPYNTTLLNDRAVEVPIARAWLTCQHGDGLEVGNVLSHYQPVEHRVVDRHEQADGVDNLDVFDIDGTYDWILAISTLEHVRWDEEPRNPKATEVVDKLLGLLRPNGRLLVTIPFAQNPYLDGALLTGAYSDAREGTMVYDPAGWEWHPGACIWTPVRERRWAGSVWVGTWS